MRWATPTAELLEETLQEEKAADEKLSALAEGGINTRAAETAHPPDTEEEEDQAHRPRMRNGRGGMAMKGGRRR